MMKHLPLIISLYPAILANSFFGGTKEVNAQLKVLVVILYQIDSVVAIYNDANEIFILPGAYKQSVRITIF